MKYFTSEDILLIHSFIIDETGGSHGLRDRGAIEALVAAPKQSFENKEQYSDIYQKAAVYLHRTIMNHPFVDGNKRTAVTVAGLFLEENGYDITVKEGDFEEFAVRVVEEKLEINEIAKWLTKHSQKRKD